jgi:hypothetical protein
MMKSKKAAIVPVWVPGLVLISLIVLTTSVIYLNKKVADLPAVGEAQQQVFETAVTAEKALVYIDTSANLAAQQAIFDLAYGGGYERELKQDCGEYLGFNLWTTSEYGDCYPKEDTTKLNFEDKFISSFSSYLSPYTEIKLPTDYRITEAEIGDNLMVIIGSAFSNIRIPIYATAERLPEVTQPVAPGAVQEIRPSKVTYTLSQEEIKGIVIELAKKYVVPESIALAVAWHESKMAQTRKTGEIKCNINLRKTGEITRDCGVMQINSYIHSGCYDASLEQAKRGICNVDECIGKTIYDTRCNVAAGLKLLLQNYERAKSMSRYVYCGDKPYGRTYTDTWDIVLRLYNGEGCREDWANYVELVRADEKGIETATMVG